MRGGPSPARAASRPARLSPIAAGVLALLPSAAGVAEGPGILSIPLEARGPAEPEESASTLDLAEVIRRAGRQNLEVRLAEAEVDAAEAERDSAAGRWWPDLALSAGRSRTEGTLQGTFGDIGTANFETALAEASLVWEVNPGAALQRAREADRTAAAARAAAEGVRARAQLSAAGKYVELLGALARRTVARQTRDDAAQFLRIARALEGQGLVPGADVHRARAELARREQQLAAAEEAGRAASVRLAEAVDLDPAPPVLPREAALEPPDLPEIGDPSVLVEKAMGDRPETHAAAREVEAARSRLSGLQWEAYGIQVDVGVRQGVIGTAFAEVGDRTIYGARVDWTFRPYEAAEIRAARSRLDAALLRGERVALRIRTEVLLALEAVSLARARLGPSADALDAAQGALRISQVRFEHGLGSALEVLQAQEAAAAARAEAITVLVHAHRAVLELQWAAGSPLGG